MKPFRERSPVPIGIIGFAVIILLLLGAFRADRLPIIGGGTTYHANFAEIGGLKSGNEVRVAGVTVGDVGKVELDGDHVRVTFRMDNGTKFGPQSGAEIRVRTLLGSEFVAIVPKGAGQMPSGGTIPVSRTVAPYDVVQAFSDLSETTEALDVDQLSNALDSLAKVAAATPEEFRGAIKGVSELSSNLAARDEQINTLLTNLTKVSGVLNSRNTELETLFRDSGVLFQAISARRDSIHRLLVSTTNISNELRTLVAQTRADLQPALKQLDVVTTMLRKNEASLDEVLNVSPTFYRVYSDALGSGPWFDNYTQPGADPNGFSLGVADQLREALGLP